jgi:hypothetical protein
METKKIRKNLGTGGTYLISGQSQEQVMKIAQETKDSIDRYRSPVVYGPNKNSQGEWVAEVKYYGLD